MITFRLYDRDGSTLLGLLPQSVSWQFGIEFSDVGGLQLEYPISGLNASLLTEMREIAVCDETGDEYSNARFVITNINRDRVEVDGTISISARSILWRLDTALVYPDGGIASGEVSRFFDTKTAGNILKTCIDAAQTRGALAGMTYNFTGAADSSSTAWGDTVIQEYPARNTILSVVRSLIDYGILEVRTIGRQLNAFKGDGLGSDLTLGTSPVVLRYGRNLTEAPEQSNADRLASATLIEGDRGLLVERTNSSSISTYGRLETSLTATGVDDSTVISALGDNFLTNLGTPARQLTVGLALDDSSPTPLTDFNVGDYVFTATTGGLERVRVRQIVMSMSGGVVSASATLGDRIFESDIRNSRRLAALTSGSVQLGNGNLPIPNVTAVVDNDGIAPAAPTSLTGTSTGYAEGIEPKAVVSLSWTNPTTNADGTPLTDLDSIEVQMRMLSTDEWQFAATSYTAGARISRLAPNTSYRFRIRALDIFANPSTFSNEFVITTGNLVATETTPSTPTVSARLGTLTIDWDGLGAGGGAMSPTFSYMAVHVSTTSGFTPGPSTYQGRMNGADTLVLADLSYQTTYYVKFVAYNKAGTASSASTQASATVVPLVNTDVIANTISGAKIQDGTLTASDKIIANTITGSLIQALAIDAGKIAANAITADKIEAGAITSTKISSTAIDGKTITGAIVRTSAGTARVEMNSTGLFVYNSSGTAVVSLSASGSASFTGTITSSDGNIGGFALSPLGMFGSQATFYSSTAAAGYSLYLNVGGLNAVGDVKGTSLTSTGGISASGAISTSGTISTSGNISTSGTGSITAAGELYAAGHGTTTSAAQGYVFVTGGRIARSTASSQRYKENIVDLASIPEMNPKMLLNLPVRAFSYKADYLDSSDDRSEAMIPGFIAEEVDALYPVAADYADGQVESWNERMILPGMLALIQDLTKEIADIKATLNGESA